MSTYTDLHNKIKENVVVNYHDRCTPQEVKFLNRNNEYWGTFTGSVNITNGLSATDAFLSGTTIVDSTLSNVTVGDMDITQIPEDMKSLSAYVLSSSEENRIIIDGLETTVEDLCSIVEGFDKRLTDNSKEISNIGQSLETVSDILSDEIVEREKQDILISANIVAYVDDVSAQTKEYINTNIENLDNKIDDTKTDIIRTITLEKHHKLLTDEEYAEINYTYPNKTIDFCVNELMVPVYDTIYNTNENIPVLGSFQNGDNKKFYSFDATNTTISDCIIPNTIYPLKDTQIPTGIGNYVLSIDDEENLWVKNDTSHIYYQITDKNGNPAGVIVDGQFDVSSFISGLVCISDRKYAETISYDELDITDNPVIHDVEAGIKVEYVGNNTLSSMYGVRDISSLILEDDTTNKLFGVILSEINNGSGINYNADGTIRNIFVTLCGDYEEIGTVVLSDETDFTTYYKPFNCISADLSGKTVSVVEEHSLFTFTARGTKLTQDGTVEEATINITPDTVNEKTLEASLLSATQISVDMTETIQNKDFSKVYVLSSNGNVWYCFDSNFDNQTNISSEINITLSGNSLVVIQTTNDIDDKSKTTTKIKATITETGTILDGNTDFIVIERCTVDEFAYTSRTEVFDSSDEYFISPDRAFTKTTNIQLYPRETDGKMCVSFPEPILDEQSTLSTYVQEFTLLIHPISYSDTRAQVELVHNDNGVLTPIKFIDDRKHTLSIPTNTWSTYTIKQIAYVDGEAIYTIDDRDETNIYARLDALDADLSNTKDEFEEALNELSDTTARQLCAVYEELSTEINDVENALNNRITEETNHLLSVIEDTTDVLMSNIVSVATELDTNVSAIHSRIDEEVEELNQTIDTTKTELSEAIDKNRQDAETSAHQLSSAILSVDDKLDDSVLTINNRIDKEVSSLLSTIDETTDNLTEIIEQNRLDAETSAGQLSSVILSVNEELNDRIDSEVSTLTQMINDNREEADTALKNVLSAHTLDRIDQTQEHTVTHLIEEYNKLLDILKSAFNLSVIIQ